VAGAGNMPRNQAVGYPAAYPGVIAAGGTNRNGGHCSNAVTGPQVLLAAPCEDISLAFKDKQRGVGSGTSNSTALIAGAVALLRAKFPSMPTREIVHRLTATAVDVGVSGRDPETGFGLIDINKALTADIAPLPAESSSLLPTVAEDPGGGPASEAASDSELIARRLAIVAGAVVVIAVLVLLVLWVRRRRSGVGG
jgi:subtilisin family serine protease